MPTNKDEFEEVIIDTEAPKSSEVEIDARVKGKQAAVKQALRDLSQENSESQDEDASVSDGTETFQAELDSSLIKHLSNPKCQVIVKRTAPVSWDGMDIEGEVFRMECPVSLEQIKSRIEDHHGGSAYRVSVHPNTPTGSMRTLSAFPIEIAGDKPPILDSENEDIPRYPHSGRRRGAFQFPDEAEWADSLDPHAVDSQNPEVMIANLYRSQAKTMSDKLRLQQLKKSVKDLQLEDEEEFGPKDDKYKQLLDEVATSRIEQKMEAKLSAIEAKMTASSNSSDMMIALMKMQEQANQANNLMRNEMASQQMQFITTIMEMNKRPGEGENFDGQLDRMVKMKEVMEGKSNKKIEDFMFDMLAEKIQGGGGEENTMAVALKEGMAAIKPALLELVSKNKPQTENLSREEAKLAYEEAGRREASKLVEKLKAQERGRLPQNPPPQVPPPSPGPSDLQMHQERQKLMEQNQALMIAAEKARLEALMKEQVKPVLPPSPENPSLTPEGEMNVPPGPLDPGYDRSLGVNFVLDAIIDDIRSGAWRNEDESYVIGDFLDRLDESLLHQFSNIKTGEELQTLVEPYAEKNKVDVIINSGKENRAIEGWIEHILITVKNYVIRGETSDMGIDSGEVTPNPPVIQEEASDLASHLTPQAPFPVEEPPSEFPNIPRSAEAPIPTILETKNTKISEDTRRSGLTGQLPDPTLQTDEENPVNLL